MRFTGNAYASDGAGGFGALLRPYEMDEQAFRGLSVPELRITRYTISIQCSFLRFGIQPGAPRCLRSATVK